MSIGLVQRKTGNPLTVPMTGPLAARLASWLLDERPATDDDRVFVRYKAPHVALRGDSSVYEAISRVMRHAGLGRRGGSRLLRRNAATRMLEAATPLPTNQRGAWPRRPRFHTRLHGHAPRGNARVRAARAGRRIVMRPTEHGFVGRLAGELEEYIRFKASMGRHGATRVRVLRSFDRHCLEHGAVRLERGVVERWIAHGIDAESRGCRSWFSYIRDFGRWMRLAPRSRRVRALRPVEGPDPRPTPYLLTDREAALFLRPRERWSLRRRGRGSLARSSCSWPAAGCAPERSGDSPSGTSTTRPVHRRGRFQGRSQPQAARGRRGRRRTAGMRPTVREALETTVRVRRHLHRQSGLPGHARRGVPPRLDAGRARQWPQAANGPGPMISARVRVRTSSGGLATAWT